MVLNKELVVEIYKLVEVQEHYLNIIEDKENKV